MIKIPKFKRSDDRIERYEATADDGARLVVWYDQKLHVWLWNVERNGRVTVTGSATSSDEAKDRAISAWIATR